MQSIPALSSSPVVSRTPSDKAEPESSTTVTISSAAVATLAAQKEALETPQ